MTVEYSISRLYYLLDMYKMSVDDLLALLVTINSSIPALIDIMSKQKALLQLTNEIFERIGVGINAMIIAETPLEQMDDK